MKKLCLLILLVMCFVLPCAAEEKPTMYTSGDYRYILLEDGTAQITGYTGGASQLEVPSELDGYCVTSIGDSAFFNCRSLTSVTLPEGMTSIGDSAFHTCYWLTSITLPEGLTSIGNSAFQYCDNLTSITLPDSVTSIGDSAFYFCRSLASITLPDSVTSIGDSAFFSCSSLASITLPDSVTSIGDSAFFSCSNLTSITLLDSVTSIGIGAFADCDSLTEITVSRDSYAEKWCLDNYLVVQYAGEWSCSECGQINSRNFCVECGAAKPVERTECGSCAYPFEEGTAYKFCPECGAAQ